MHRKKITWTIKQEVLFVLGGLFAFCITYYTRMPWLMILGLGILVMTSVFWGYSIQRMHPMGLKEFRLIKDKWILQVLVAFPIIGVWFAVYQAYMYVSRGQGLNLKYGGSTDLLFAIVIVIIAEEVFFNGYLLTRLRIFTANPWLRPLIAMMIFSLYKVAIHLWEGYPPTYYAELFVLETLSYPTSWWSERTGSIVAALIVHLAVDLFMYGHRFGVPNWVF